MQLLIKKKVIASTEFIVTPATKMMARFHHLILLSERSGGTSTPSGNSTPSPYIETYPPKGIPLKEN